MKNLRILILSLTAALSATVASAASVHVGNAYVGGVYGTFGIEYEEGAPGLQVQNVTFELSAPLYLDPTFNSPGAILPFPFTVISGSAETGFTGVSGVYDGSTSFTLNFADFNPGELFQFELDVDGPCGGFLCIPGAITTGEEFEGTKIHATFGGLGYETRQLSAVTFYETGPYLAEADIYGDIAPVPEPASMALMAAGLAAVAFRKKIISRS